MPSFISIPIRRVMGASIGKGAKFKFGTIILSNTLSIGDNVILGPFCYISAESVSVGSNSMIRSFTLIRTKLLELGINSLVQHFVIILGEPNDYCNLYIGDFSRVYSFTYIEPTHSIRIGKRVGVGGFCLLFTHSNWSDFIDGGPITKGPIIIEDDVWVPWNVFLGPNTYIESKSIIGANSFVNSRISAGSYASGSPAKVIHKGLFLRIPKSKKIRNAYFIINEFYKSYPYLVDSIRISVNDSILLVSGDILVLIEEEINSEKLSELCLNGIHVLDHNGRNFHFANNRKNDAMLFFEFLKSYSIRLYTKNG
jgi:acetyltransferase-like isoleucine patch superfamily enzyme